MIQFATSDTYFDIRSHAGGIHFRKISDCPKPEDVSADFYNIRPLNVPLRLADDLSCRNIHTEEDEPMPWDIDYPARSSEFYRLGFGYVEGKHNGWAYKHASRWPMPYRACVVPYWFLLSLALVGPLLHAKGHARTVLRRRRNLCVECGYDLRETPEQCPECGAPGSQR